MSYLIVTDTGADLSSKYYMENKVPFIGIRYTINNQNFVEDPDPSNVPAFYDQIRAGAMPTTSMANIQDYLAFFEPLLARGDDLLYIGFSSGLSGSVGCGSIAAEELRARFPERKIYVVDSLCASMGQGLLVELAVQQRNAGKSLDDVYHWVEEHKLNLNHLFTASDLMHLHRGGRVSRTSAVLGTLIGIKPVLFVDTQGHLIPASKKRGRKASLHALVEWMETLIPAGTHLPTIGISHADCYEDAKLVEKLVREKYHVDKCIINYIGKVIGSHTGQGTVALFFLGHTRKA